MEEAKGVVTPGTKEESITKDDHEDKFYEQGHHQYRAVVARLNYLASDRPDMALPVKASTRSMSFPTTGCQDKLKS